jgi:hypothetical protein
MPWLIRLLLPLLPEIIRGGIAIVRDRLAARKAEAEARKSAEERRKAEAEDARNDKPYMASSDK